MKERKIGILMIEHDMRLVLDFGKPRMFGRLEPDGSLLCGHAAAPAGDQRTRSCLNHSLALLLLELTSDL